MLVFVSVSHSMYPVEMEPSTDITRNKQRYTSQNIHTVILIGNLPKKKVYWRWMEKEFLQ